MKKRYLIDTIFALLTIYSLLILLPGSLFYTPITYSITSVVSGETPEVLIDRKTTFFSFLATYNVDVRYASGDSKNAVACGSGTTHEYLANLSGVRISSLREWAANDSRCSRLPIGKYYSKTCWRIHQPFFGLVNDKNVCTKVAFFSIYEDQK